MEDYSASTYGDRIAGVYDDRYSDFQDLGPVVRTMADLVGGWPALELDWASARTASRCRWPHVGGKEERSTWHRCLRSNDRQAAI